jgi:hypothetical protein
MGAVLPSQRLSDGTEEVTCIDKNSTGGGIAGSILYRCGAQEPVCGVDNGYVGHGGVGRPHRR